MGSPDYELRMMRLGGYWLVVEVLQFLLLQKGHVQLVFKDHLHCITLQKIDSFSPRTAERLSYLSCLARLGSSCHLLAAETEPGTILWPADADCLLTTMKPIVSLSWVP